MSEQVLALSVAVALLGSLGACASGPVAPTEPKVASEGECRGAVNPQRCKFKHDAAGGYPFTLDYSNDPG